MRKHLGEMTEDEWQAYRQEQVARAVANRERKLLADRISSLAALKDRRHWLKTGSTGPLLNLTPRDTPELDAEIEELERLVAEATRQPQEEV